MTEDKTEERKPFMSFSFNEEGNFDRYAGIYLHVPLEKPPTPEEIAIMVGTIKSFAKTWHTMQGQLGLLEGPPPGAAGLRAPTQTPQDEREAPPREREDADISSAPNRPRGGATEPQCKKILAVCHRVDDQVVTKLIENFAGVEWRLSDEGRCIPNWDFLRSLTMQQASNIIERLERAEA